MAQRNANPKPTDAELEILRVLWRQGPATVRQVCEALNRDRIVGYTTVLKLLQIMTDKGLVTREYVEQRAHVYAARASEEYAQRRMVKDLLDRVFDGSAQKLVLHALTAKKASAEELAQLRRLLDELEGEL